MRQSINKRKIINDPVHGFIKIPFEILYDLIEHPIVQRLRRIRQLGLTSYVYPGAMHTRFQHALGAMYLMGQAIDNIRSKGLDITIEEEEAATAAILLHDIGHGPFSHALENSIIEEFNHEKMSEILFDVLNEYFDNQLELAIRIFNNQYHKKFLHQLVSGQLDVDRLDYLKRDSFYTGVTEGVIGSDRIIKMLNVVNDNLVVEAKGIYSIEKFIIARRLMYWQVYFHKTVISAENLLVKLLQRAKYIALRDKGIEATKPFQYFLENSISKTDMKENAKTVIDHFIMLDDNDIIVSAKQWMNHPDSVLAKLSFGLINRNLPRTEIQDKPFPKRRLVELRENVKKKLDIQEDDMEYFVFSDEIYNSTYNINEDDKIQILFKNNEIKDVTEASDILDVTALNKTVKKYFLTYPKECGI